MTKHRFTHHMPAASRTNDLLDAALRVAKRDGFNAMRRDAIAVEAGVTGGLVTIRLGTMTALRRAVMRHAILQRCLPVVAEGIATGDRQALKAPAELREAAGQWLAAR